MLYVLLHDGRMLEVPEARSARVDGAAVGWERAQRHHR